MAYDCSHCRPGSSKPTLACGGRLMEDGRRLKRIYTIFRGFPEKIKTFSNAFVYNILSRLKYW